MPEKKLGKKSRVVMDPFEGELRLRMRMMTTETGLTFIRSIWFHSVISLLSQVLSLDLQKLLQAHRVILLRAKKVERRKRKGIVGVGRSRDEVSKTISLYSMCSKI